MGARGSAGPRHRYGSGRRLPGAAAPLGRESRAAARGTLEPGAARRRRAVTEPRGAAAPKKGRAPPAARHTALLTARGSGRPGRAQRGKREEARGASSVGPPRLRSACARAGVGRRPAGPGTARAAR